MNRARIKRRRYITPNDTDYAMHRIFSALGSLVASKMEGAKTIKQFRKNLMTLVNNDEFWQRVEGLTATHKEFVEFMRCL